MSERNKKTPWDEELEAQVLAEERAKRKQANIDQLEAFETLSPAPPAKPATSPAVDNPVFADENTAVEHFEREFATGNEPQSLWERLENHFGAKELRIYVGAAVLILMFLLFSIFFNSLATKKIAARAAKQQTASQEAASQEAAEAVK